MIVTEDSENPSQWSYGRIVKVHPGDDGLVRVAEVFCRQKTLLRPIHKLSLLPILDNEKDESTVSIELDNKKDDSTAPIELDSSRRGSMVQQHNN